MSTGTDTGNRTSALDTLVFGVDIHSGDVRGDSQSYALVRFDGEGFDRDVVSRRKLLRLVESDEPDIVATDNVYELVEDKDALVRLLRALPPETKLVQVTGSERPEPLSRVASRHDVPYGKKPIREAEAAARLSTKNVGYEVSAFENTTRVKVSRGRSTGKGGWSEDRYTRKIHGAVKRRANEIEDELESKGFEYESEVTEKYGGYSNAVFEVEATRDELPFSESRSDDVRVEIEPVRSDGIEFESLAERRDPVFVGVDPGTTTAVAVVDLGGEVLNVMSTRTGDSSEVIEWMIEKGRPVLVASDVTPMPDTVEKLRRSFDAAGWSPDTDLLVEDKKLRASEYEYKYDNDHERDAVAAALEAYDDLSDRLKRVREKVPPRGFDEGEVVKRVLRDDESVEAVLKELEDDEESDEDDGGSQREPTEEERRIRQLEKRVGRLQSHVEELEDELDEKRERIKELEEEVTEARSETRHEVRKEREVKRLERKNRSLEKKLSRTEDEREELEEKLDRLKKLWKVDHSDFAGVEGADGYAVVKPVDEFTVSALEEADESFGLSEDDVVLLRDASGAGRRTAERLADVDPRAVLKRGNMSQEADEVLFENDVPVGPADDVPTREVDELAIARESDIENVIEDWEERAEERRRAEKEEMVDKLITEYRVEREKE